MQVSKLEIKGFKSFGDKITINFDDGITGIVGPNGCGKSNIVDAIRWVLGEQKTRNLRSDKMENVIFNGSRNRKPLQMAEVSLTFNNNKGILPTEYSQVTVTRKYFRTGDSEYQLNGVTCRLKDITDLFLDTGIGSDSYAIIELKMVDELLNDKEGSRRTLFEEAAGISKFKVRKKQTLKKLEETDADLERLEDVLFEISKNLKSLERQAKLAEKYVQLKDEYKTYSLEYARRNISQYTEKLERLENDLKKEVELKTTFADELEALENNIAEHKTHLDETQLELNNNQRIVHEQTAQLRQLENEIRLKSERILYLRERITTLRQQIASENSQQQQTEASIVALQQEADQIQDDFAIAEEQVNNLKDELQQHTSRKNDLTHQQQDLNTRQRQQQQAVFQNHKEIEIAEAQVQSLTAELDRMGAHDLSEEEITRQFEENLQSAAEALEDKNQELAAAVAHETQLKQDIGQTEAGIQELRSTLIEHNRKLDSKKNQYSLTKSLVENLEGFPEAIKFLYKTKNWTNPAPLLSDLIVCQQEYKALIESYLEPYMNFFVVDTTADAIEAIQLLNNQNKGRANFIILSEIEDLDTTLTVSSGKNKAALEVVSAAEKYHNLLRYMLQEVYISPEEDPAMYSGDHRTFILKDGSIIKKPLSLSGGSVGLFDGNRIGRKQNLEKLAEEIAEMTQQADVLKSKISTQQQVLQNLKAETRQEQIKQLEKEVAHLTQELMGIRIRHEQHLLNKQSHQAKKEELAGKLRELQLRITQLKPQAEADQELLQHLEEEIASFTDLVSRQNEVIGEFNTIFNQENIKYHQLKNRLMSVQQEINYKQKTIETNQVRLLSLQDELARSTDEIGVSEELIAEKQDILENLAEEKQALSQKLDGIEKAYFLLRGEIDLKEKTIRELQRKRQNADEIHLNVQQALNEVHLKLVAVKERLSAEFNISDEDLMHLNPEPLEMPTEELSASISSIKSRLDNMGPVNMTAAEAYTEINERNEFIKAQRTDLINAKNALIDTINEIDTVAKTKFLESFDLIKENFLRVFRSLFSDEDTCDLVLADPANPLESKIEIMARPKGKRPLTINQLSGGEKTLTAISLLFAIYLLKPAPFCIFDEVDAPLDDANIDKFNNIIRTFSGESQFIVVTHNKRTMASTDVIYGITMAEPGVSRVIPVDLRAMA